MRWFSVFLLIALLLGRSVSSQDSNAAPVTAEPGTAALSQAYVIPIQGEIDRALMVFIRRGIKEAKEAEAGTIIFMIDTFGGRVDSALQIATLIGSVDTIQTVAFVPAGPETTGVSWSAGALISFSCNRIYMAPGTSMGAVAPVYQTSEGMKMAPEKTVSAVRAQMASLAEKNGYPKAVALAMVDMDVELLEVFLDGKLILTTTTDLPDLERQAGQEGLKLEKGKTVSPQGKLLTLTAGEAEKYGVSSGRAADLEALYAALGVAESGAIILGTTVPDKIVALLTSSVLTTLLVMIGLVAIYLEITSPGFGVPGTIAILCFATIFLGNALLGTVGSLELLIFLLGVVLLVVEIFLIPGFGVTGISGILLIFFSLVLSRQDFVWPKFDWQWEQFGKNLRLVGLGLLGSIVLVTVFLRLFPRAPFFNRLILKSSEASQDGFTAQAQEITGELIGKKGASLTPLRPAGKAEIDNSVLMVETDGEFLESGHPVEVIEVSGNRILVRGC